MIVRTYLLTRADVERRLLARDRLISTNEPDRVEIGICPVIELLELCELVKKGSIKTSLPSFQTGMQAFQDGSVRRGEVVIISLDQNRLADSLFERDDGTITGLWYPAANHRVSPTHSVRRLLLRPSEQTWWNGDIFAEAEAIYSAEGLE